MLYVFDNEHMVSRSDIQENRTEKCAVFIYKKVGLSMKIKSIAITNIVRGRDDNEYNITCAISIKRILKKQTANITMQGTWMHL